MISLPPHRQLLTGLIDSLSRTAPAPPPSPTREALNASEDGPADRRHLLLTLHVLFPDVLLPALDVLDRGLVTHITCPISGPRQDESKADSPSATVYTVRSLASTLTRRKRDTAVPSTSYIVRLDAWNCSCAGFTVDAFQPSHTDGSPAVHPTKALDWEFGGLSLDGLPGTGGEDIPCCKHLLACLLAERRDAVLGTRVESRSVTKEELAGIVADL